MMPVLSFLEKLVGLRITSVARILYEFGGQLEPEDGPVEFGTDNHVVLLDGAGDGESLRVQEGSWKDPFKHPLSEENQQYIEGHGRWRRVDCSQLDAYSNFIGERITKVSSLANEHGRIAALQLSVSTRTMWFVVEGDECHVRWVHPIGFTEMKG